MKRVVITGGTRGIGRGLALELIKRGCLVSASGTADASISEAGKFFSEAGYPVGYIDSPQLPFPTSPGIVLSRCDVAEAEDISRLWENSVRALGAVDIWINNAGINQPDKPVEQLTGQEIERVVSVDLLGTIQATRLIYLRMQAQGYGFIYNMEGFGSDGRIQSGLSVYGTSKRGVTYFTKAFCVETAASQVRTGLISPGMVLTDFLLKPLKVRDNESFSRLVRVYTTLADYVEVVTPFLARRILTNRHHGKRIAWLTPGKVFWRFLTGGRRKNRPDIGSLL